MVFEKRSSIEKFRLLRVVQALSPAAQVKLFIPFILTFNGKLIPCFSGTFVQTGKFELKYKGELEVFPVYKFHRIHGAVYSEKLYKNFEFMAPHIDRMYARLRKIIACAGIIKESPVQDAAAALQCTLAAQSSS